MQVFLGLSRRDLRIFLQICDALSLKLMLLRALLALHLLSLVKCWLWVWVGKLVRVGLLLHKLVSCRLLWTLKLTVEDLGLGWDWRYLVLMLLILNISDFIRQVYLAVLEVVHYCILGSGRGLHLHRNFLGRSLVVRSRLLDPGGHFGWRITLCLVILFLLGLRDDFNLVRSLGSFLMVLPLCWKLRRLWLSLDLLVLLQSLLVGVGGLSLIHLLIRIVVWLLALLVRSLFQGDGGGWKIYVRLGDEIYVAVRIFHQEFFNQFIYLQICDRHIRGWLSTLDLLGLLLILLPRHWEVALPVHRVIELRIEQLVFF